MTFVDTVQEEMLLKIGYDALSITEKNKLISLLADREGIPYSEITEQYLLDHHKLLKKAIVSTLCEEAILKGFTASNGHIYRTNRDDQINLIGQKIELDDFPDMATVVWKTEDVEYIVHTREEWLTIYREAFAYKKKQLFKYNTMKAAIAKALTHQELVLLDWGLPKTPEELA